MNRKVPLVLKMIMASALALSFLLGTASCSVFKDILGISQTEPHESHRRNREIRGVKTEKGSDMTVPTDPTDPTDPTITPTGTHYTDPTGVTYVDLDVLKSVYVYSVWYDAVDDNPVDYDAVATDDAFALKAVFYFRTPLTCRLEAKLYMDDEVLLTRYVDLKENVTAEADFSAGLEGFGVFKPGNYYVELCFDGEQIASSNIMKVI